MISYTASSSIPGKSIAFSAGKSLIKEIAEPDAIDDSQVQFANARIALVDDDERTREALTFQLTTAGCQVIAFASANEILGRHTVFDCIVADIFMPSMNGLQLQEQLITRNDPIPIVFITGRGDLAMGVLAMKRGAVDVLEKPVQESALLSAIARAVERSRADRERHRSHDALQIRFGSLPARQRQVFILITAGLPNKQVAAELGITERTVKVHRERMRRRMGADSLADLSRIAEILKIHPGRSLSAGI
jgi:RNA polymerase sigma factor (sigma-70 family)